MVEEVGCADSVLEVREDEGHELHELLLALEVVEAKEREVVVDAEEDSAVDLARGVVADNLDVGHQRLVDAFSDVHVLEKFVVAFLLVQVAVNRVSSEILVVDLHQQLDVFEVYVLLQRSGQEEQVLEDARAVLVQLFHAVVRLVYEIFVVGVLETLEPQNVLVGQDLKLLPHVLQRHVDFQQVAFAAHEDALELVDEVLPLLEEQPQHAQRRAQQVFVVVGWQLQQGQHHRVEGGRILLARALEQIPVFAHVVLVGMFERRELLELVAPNVDLEHDILVFAYFLHVFPQQQVVLVLVEFLPSHLVSAIQLRLFYFTLLLLLVVVIEVLCRFVKSFEKVHHISKPNVDL